MKYNYIGKTGLMVSELCFGTMTFGGQDAGMWDNIGRLQQKEVNKMLESVIDSGINFIDTADVYSFGQSEQLLGQGLKDLRINRDEIVISTKVFGKMKEKPNSSGLSRYHIFNAVDDSLNRLQLEYLDILYVHGVDFQTGLEEIVRSLNDVVESGKIRYIAICNWPAWMVAKAQAIAHYNGWHKFIGLQYFYSAVTRDIEHEIVAMADNHDLAIFPWSPLAGGFLSGKYTREEIKDNNSRRATFDFPPIDKDKAYDLVDIMKTIADDHQATIAQVALAWVRQQSGVTSTVIGAKNVEQLISNVESTKLILSGSDLLKIQQVSPLSKQYPGWMIENQDKESRS
ncbi:MAG: aldo/keto reductase [Chryseobacterium sp.]|jgi:aryl-alcohol dehydrogenase-like predicted oxidoreductase|nr:aldo/keto reductase [Chryseobacterium sp.]